MSWATKIAGFKYYYIGIRLSNKILLSFEFISDSEKYYASKEYQEKPVNH